MSSNTLLTFFKWYSVSPIMRAAWHAMGILGSGV